MFGSDQVLFVFHGPFGVRVEVHSSILMLGLLVLAFGYTLSLHDVFRSRKSVV